MIFGALASYITVLFCAANAVLLVLSDTLQFHLKMPSYGNAKLKLLTLAVPLTVLVLVATKTEVPFHTCRVIFCKPELSLPLQEKFWLAFAALELPFNGASRLAVGVRITLNKTAELFSFPDVSFAYTLTV